MVDITQPGAWDRVAPGYAEVAAGSFAPYAEAALRLAQVSAGERVLDVATGPGTLAVLAAATAEVTAVDFSAGMIEVVRRRAAERGLSRLTGQVADGQALPFADASFDAAFSMFGLFMFPDRAAGLRELARVLRPGGRAVVGTWAPRDADHPFTRIGALLQPEGEPAPTEEPPAAAAMPLSDPEELKGEMSDAGLEVTVQRFDHTLSFDSASALAESILRSHVGFVALEAEQPAERFGRVARALEAMLHEALGDGRVEVPLSAWLGLGVKPD